MEHIKTQQAEVHHLLTVKPDVMDIAAAEDLQTTAKTTKETAGVLK